MCCSMMSLLFCCFVGQGHKLIVYNQIDSEKFEDFKSVNENYWSRGRLLIISFFCFQSQTYSFEVAQEHIETLQRK